MYNHKYAYNWKIFLHIIPYKINNVTHMISVKLINDENTLCVSLQKKKKRLAERK